MEDGPKPSRAVAEKKLKLLEEMGLAKITGHVRTPYR